MKKLFILILAIAFVLPGLVTAVVDHRYASKPAQEQFIGQDRSSQYDMTNVELWYKVYNKKFFGDRLPRTVMFIATDTHTYPPSERLLGRTECNVGRTVCTISIDVHYNVADVTMQLTTLHEMCHIQEWDPDMASDRHGPRWNVCMENLYRHHAFDGLL